MLGADELVFQSFGFGLRGLGHLPKAGREGWLRSAVSGGLFRQLAAKLIGNQLRLDAHLAQQRRHDTLGLFNQREQQVLRVDLGVVALLGEPLRRGSFLRLFGVLVRFIALSRNEKRKPIRSSFHRLSQAAELFPPASFASAS